MIQQTNEEYAASLPLIGASWYDWLIQKHPGLAAVMTRDEYVRSFCEVYYRPFTITSGGTTQ
jgi:hypothetical protein